MMAGVKYDPFSGYLRVSRATDIFDAQALLVVNLHVALEREIEIVLGKLLPRAHKLRRNMGFGHKVSVLEAAWTADPGAADRLAAVLLRFNDLRNAIAHGDRNEVVACNRNLIEAYRRIDPNAPNNLDLGRIAQGICAFIGDGPTPEDVRLISEALDEVMAAMEKL